jgi:hypothetical protein
MSKSSDKYQKAAANFVATMLHSGTNAHLLHLKENSYARHVALGKFYEKIIDEVDSFAEAYQGCYGVIETYPTDFHAVKDDPVAYMEMLSEYVEKIRKTLPEESQLQQLVDNIAELIDTTLYKLVNLK